MKVFTNKKHVTVKLLDGTDVTPKSAIVIGYADIPDLPDVMVKVPLEPVLDRGNLIGVKEGPDSLEYPEVEITVDMVDAAVVTGKYELEQWFNQHKDGTGADLTSTNDGAAQARSDKDGSLVDVTIPTDFFTIAFGILFDTGDDGKAFGRKYNYCRPIPGSVSVGDKGQYKFKLQLCGTFEEITTL